MRKKILFYSTVMICTLIVALVPKNLSSSSNSPESMESVQILAEQSSTQTQFEVALPTEEVFHQPIELAYESVAEISPQYEDSTLIAMHISENPDRTSGQEAAVQHYTDPDFFSRSLALPAVERLEQEIMNFLVNANIIENEVVSLAGYTLEEGEEIIHATVQEGDTAGIILNNWINQSDINEAIIVAEPIHSLPTIHLDRPYAVVLDQNGYFKRFEYERYSEIFVLKAMPLVSYNDAGEEHVNYEFVAELVPIEYEIELAFIEATIDISLYGALVDAGETPALVPTLVDIFSYKLDFFRDIRQGDTFQVLVEKKYRDGVFEGYGDTLAATFDSRFVSYAAFLHESEDGSNNYYDETGEAFETLLLRTPLDFTRISSGYSMSRMHPILGYPRPHQGIDYAAPTGTPVRTVGDGVVTFVGVSGGYGNLIIVQHTNGLESQYAHLSRFDSSTTNGARVEQGQTIGYVGSTGLSTGPHLDFRIKLNGEFVNPDTVTVPNAPPLEGDVREEFLMSASIMKEYIEGTRALSSYVPNEQ